ncbi:MAG: hypothetical protein JKY54_06355, partial [Flavobacteriales bacterium]|nr:hypothetical protein [Flavobacteriales bacterium]
RTVLRNLGLNKRRSDAARSNRERRVAKTESLPSAAEEAERAEYLGLVAHAVQTLPEPYRAIVLLRYWDGLAPRDIARLRNVPVATIKTRC